MEFQALGFKGFQGFWLEISLSLVFRDVGLTV